MAKEKKKGFFKEFKDFIMRGNVLDMAVGVIIGGAFTAIVNALSNNILKPIINWFLALILGKNSLNEVYTFLVKVTTEDGMIDLAQSIYIDWGAFINAIINFLLIALVLFTIIKVITKLAKIREQIQKEAEEAAERRMAEKLAKEAAEKAALNATVDPADPAEKAETPESTDDSKS